MWCKLDWPTKVFASRPSVRNNTNFFRAGTRAHRVCSPSDRTPHGLRRVRNKRLGVHSENGLRMKRALRRTVIARTPTILSFTFQCGHVFGPVQGRFENTPFGFRTPRRVDVPASIRNMSAACCSFPKRFSSVERVRRSPISSSRSCSQG